MLVLNLISIFDEYTKQCVSIEAIEVIVEVVKLIGMCSALLFLPRGLPYSL